MGHPQKCGAARSGGAKKTLTDQFKTRKEERDFTRSRRLGVTSPDARGA
jgi:hypothetical protein